MLKNQKSLLLKQVFLKNEVDDLLAALKVVWGVRENKVELLDTALQIEEDISLNGIEILELKLLGRLADKVMVHAIYLHRGHATGLTWCKLIAYWTRAWE